MPPASPQQLGPQANNYVLLVLDSCRYDSMQRARTPNIDRLGPVEQRWSYASWTAPSHFNLLMGLLPHVSPPGVTSSGYYKIDIWRFRERLGIDAPNFKHMSTAAFLPKWLQSFGYRTHAIVSMPILWANGPINFGFDRYVVMPELNDFEAILPLLEFRPDCPATGKARPSFYLLNTGATHYPYAEPGSTHGRHWPRKSGVRGVFERIAEIKTGERNEFDADAMAELHGRQIAMVEHCDRVIGDLYRILPANTWLTITSDHGELFGEGGYFGHGPIQHPLVFSVPFVDGMVPPC